MFRFFAVYPFKILFRTFCQGNLTQAKTLNISRFLGRFETITSTCYRGAQGIMIVYDVTDEKSFKNVPKWIRKIKELSNPNVQKVLVANKCDLKQERLITKEKGELLAKHLGIRHKEISALSNLNVEDAFSTLLRKVFKQASNEDSWAEQTVDVSAVHEPPPCNPSCCAQ